MFRTLENVHILCPSVETRTSDLINLMVYY